MAEIRGLTDSNLLYLLRKAAKVLFNNTCFVCKLGGGELDAHHTVKRKNFLLRYNYRNSILCHRYVCHAFLETPEGKRLITDYQQEKGYSDYLQEHSGQAKDWLVKHGMTKNDYKKEMAYELKTIIKI